MQVDFITNFNFETEKIGKNRKKDRKIKSKFALDVLLFIEKQFRNVYKYIRLKMKQNILKYFLKF